MTPFTQTAWWALLRLTTAHRKIMALTLVLGLLTQVGGTAAAGLGAWIVGRAGLGAFADALSGLRFLAALVLLVSVCTWLESWLAHDLAYRILASLRERVFDALARLAPAGTQDRRSGDLVATAMTDVEQLEWFYAHTAGALVICTLTPLAVLAALASIHVLLALVLLPLLLAAGVLPTLLRKQAQVQGRVLRQQLATVNAEVVDAVQGLRELSVFGAETRMRDRLAGHGNALLGSQLAYGLRAGAEGAVALAVTGLGMLVVLAVAARLTVLGAQPAALYPVAVVLAGAAFGPVTALSGMLGNLGTIEAAADRVFGLLHRKAPVTSPEHPSAPPSGPWHIGFHQVGFTYAGQPTPALCDVTLEIRPGETVAVAGASGAGKSTLAKLLTRVYDPQCGSITLNGIDLRALRLEDLRALTAPVPQDTYLFDMSLADNIRLGKPDADDRDVEEAARAACAHDFITALPAGYHTMACERGLNLSGGQRRRIAIARALITQAPIVIFDEATADLDLVSERAVQRAWDQIRGRRTCLVIAHRLSTLLTADRVVVLEQGRIVAQGPPHELLAGDGPLARLTQAQWAPEEEP